MYILASQLINLKRSFIIQEWGSGEGRGRGGGALAGQIKNEDDVLLSFPVM